MDEKVVSGRLVDREVSVEWDLEDGPYMDPWPTRKKEDPAPGPEETEPDAPEQGPEVEGEEPAGETSAPLAVYARGTPWLQYAGVAVLLAGMVFVLTERRVSQAGRVDYLFDSAWLPVDFPLWYLGALLMLLGAIGIVYGLTLPHLREILVYDAEELGAWVEREARIEGRFPLVGGALLGLGFLEAFLVYHYGPADQAAAQAAIGIVLMVGGIAFLVAGALRRPLLMRLRMTLAAKGAPVEVRHEGEADDDGQVVALLEAALERLQARR